MLVYIYIIKKRIKRGLKNPVLIFNGNYSTVQTQYP